MVSHLNRFHLGKIFELQPFLKVIFCFLEMRIVDGRKRTGTGTGEKGLERFGGKNLSTNE